MSETPPRPIVACLPRLRAKLRDASALLVCLDFDGTLAPIVDEPDAAAPTAENEAALETLADTERISTAIVSGRALADVRARVGPATAYAGNHGLELDRDGSVTVHPAARERATLVETVCGLLEVALDPIPGTRVENKRLTGTVHVRQVLPVTRPIVRELTRDAVDRIGGDDLELSSGKCVLEISPSVSWGKGDAVCRLETASPDDTLTIYVGDDVTDESAFRAVEPDGVGVRVGDDSPSAASCRVRSPDDVTSLLEWLVTTGVDLLENDRSRSPSTTDTDLDLGN
ncbi:trehalose-phosphatase [Natrialbaceae archaeon AArc-T1-2]|uniref:trehalose-phosphatase n=1 Tax=Natrialbaceae archaeon AArc-T1-2 TaxID=3053904 RepID=UPI00255AC885|nr:trehalose-phosphatase [Natrialbaceae archaeon AArc-T1-2]WIV67195.1 trehalose-phosphatase [Natrialbaceae archaeon AArc-T1-2]